MATVFLGTFYPLFAQLSTGVKLSVGPPYFDHTFVPILVPGILAMVLGPSLAWRRANLGQAMRRLAPALLVASAAPFLLHLLLPRAPWAALGGVALALWAMLGVASDLMGRASRHGAGPAWRRLPHVPRGAYGYSLAHFGVGMVIAGIVVSTAWRSETIASVHPGQSIKLAGLTLDLVGVSEEKIANYDSQRAQIRVQRPDGSVYALYPELRTYPISGERRAHTAIHTNGLADLYLALGEPDGKGGFVLRAYYNPLVPWIWFGAGLAALGGLLSLADRRLAVRAARRAAPALFAQRAKPG
jgi:cytochrome c-type biogenesis protein CcmF